MYLSQIISNKIINVTLLAWFIAQLSKVILIFITNKKIDFKRFIGAGGMPSSHAATAVSLATCIAKSDGLSSSTFAISFIISLVVMYDAAGVRRAAGNQARILNKIVQNWGVANPEFINVKLKELIGHTPIQVFVGALIGLVIGIIAY